MYIVRGLEKIVIQTSEHFPVLLVTGPRQIGKTTLLKKLAEENRTYVTLDDPIVRRLAKEDPGLFLQRYRTPVIIDEIQYAPELLPYIKMNVDKDKKSGDYWLTGSQMFHLMKNVSESLAGRVGVINMLGLSYAEITGRIKKPFIPEVDQLFDRISNSKPEDLSSIYNRIHKGSMPALYEKDQDTEMYYASYVNTYIQRDVKDLTQIGDEQAFLRFLSVSAARTSQMVNYSEMAKEIGVSAQTVKQWLSILITSGLVVLIEPYFNNALKRVVKTPMMYFLDTGLCAYLTRWTTSEALEIGAMSGAFFESYIVAEIIKSYLNNGKRPPIYYYRDKEKKEIDLIIEQNNMLYPIEIKKSGNPKRSAIKHFEVLKKTGKEVGTGSVISMVGDLIPVDENNYFVPEWII